MSQKMTLNDVLILCAGRLSPADALSMELECLHITEDSRKVVKGSLFVAIKGDHVDGNAFIPQARSQGAVAFITENESAEPNDLPRVIVAHARKALGLIAHAMAGDPSQGLTVIGVTGTNGKSSTVTMIQHLLKSSGRPTACFGTLGYIVGATKRKAPHTTPFNEDLAELFAEARDAGDTHVVMEVSSHALAQHRVSGIHFDIALFTNLTQDHLDYHETMDAYLDAKLMLFRDITSSSGITIANADDPKAEAYRNASSVQHHTFGKSGDVKIGNVAIVDNKSTFSIDSEWGSETFEMGLLGKHNVSNMAGAITTCLAMGIDMKSLKSAVRDMPSVPGRFESVNCGQSFGVIVDYAHTPDGLLNVLIAAGEVCGGRVIAIFGCGGDRDKTKRPKMAAIVAEHADFAILTSDNPRTESPERILMDMEVGMQRSGKKRDEEYVVIEDRREAILSGLAIAQPGDLVMIAGKGHEDYQILNTGVFHFDDREVAREWLEQQA